MVIKAVWHSSMELGIGCKDLLYLMEHCILKTSCEAVVESFCSIIARHGSANRHCDQSVYTKEAYVAANGPAIGHAAPFIAACNDRIFAGNKARGWHFVTRLFGAMRRVQGESSKTLDRLAIREKTRLPFMRMWGEQKPVLAASTGLIVTPEWLKGSKLRWKALRAKKKARKMQVRNDIAASGCEELDGEREEERAGTEGSHRPAKDKEEQQ